MSDESMLQIVSGNHGCRVHRAKDEKDHSDCYQPKVQTQASVMARQCVSADSMAKLHIYESTINADMYRKVVEQHLFQVHSCIFMNRYQCTTVPIFCTFVCVLNIQSWYDEIYKLQKVHRGNYARDFSF